MSNTTAIVTASYAPDFERCRWLCQSIDKYVSGYSCHFLLVEAADVALFKQLEGPRRKVIDERELLPSWLKVFPDPLSFGRRRVWLSLKTPPLRGWHTQQLRRIAIARHRPEDAFFYCDSDTVFVREFDVSSVWKNSQTRLFRREKALLNYAADADHSVWAQNAASLLGLNNSLNPEHDYIGTLIAWRRDTSLALIDHIEKASGKNWVEAIAARRRFSECLIYGQFADTVMAGKDHWFDQNEYCHMFWLEPMPPRDEFIASLKSMEPHQVAIGIQSFLGGNIADLKSLIEAAKI